MKRVLGISALLVFSSACSTGTPPSEPERPKADLGEPSDDVDPELIGVAVRDNSRQFQLCLETARERNPELMGLVEVRFLINTDGSIGQAMVVETDMPSSIADCIVEAFYNVKLPQQESAVVAQYPMYFQPS